MGLIALLAALAAPHGALAQPSSDAAQRATVRITLELTSVPPETPAEARPTLGSNLNAWDPGAPDAAFTRGDDGVYRLTLEVPRFAALEYKVTLGSWSTVERGADGRDLPNRSLRAVGDQTVAFAVEAWAALEPPEAPAGGVSTVAGRVERLEGVASPQLGNVRDVQVYLPPGYDDEPGRRYPVLYLQDGQNVFDVATSYARAEWGADEAAEASAAAGRPVILVAIPNMGVDRLAEYGPFPSAEADWIARGEPYAAFVMDTLKPRIDAAYRTLPDREHTGVAGSSAGGVISLYLALRYPERIGFAGVLSPAFHLGGDTVFPWVRAHPAPGLRAWLDMGDQEGDDMLMRSRWMATLLRSQGTDVRYQVAPGAAHFEDAWRARFPQVLAWFLDGPEARVGEEAAGWLRRAVVALGGPAFGDLARARVDLQSTAYRSGPDGPVALPPADVRLVADLAAGLVRVEYLADGRAQGIIQADATGGWLWGAGGDTRELTPDEVVQHLRLLRTGPLGLVAGAAGRDVALVEGTRRLLDAEGTAVTVSTDGARSTYVLADDGTVLAEEHAVPGGSAQVTRYRNLRWVDGVRFPFALDDYVDGAILSSLRVVRFEPDPELPADAFARP